MAAEGKVRKTLDMKEKTAAKIKRLAEIDQVSDHEMMLTLLDEAIKLRCQIMAERGEEDEILEIGY